MAKTASMKRLVPLRPCLLLFLLVCSAFSAHATDWPYYQHDAGRSGASTANVNPPELTLAWSAPEGYAVPLVVGDTIYSTHTQGGFTGSGHVTMISAFHLATGAIKWTYSGEFSFPSMAAVAGGLVVFHSGSGQGYDPGQLYVLDAITGALRYKVDVRGNPNGPVPDNVMPLLVPNPADGTVMAYCADPYFLRAVQLGPTSGSVLWTQSLVIGGQFVLPTLVGNSIVLEARAYDVATGAWNQFYHTGSNVIPVAYDPVRRHIYISKDDSDGPSLTAYRYTSNEQIDFLWQHFGGGTGWDSVAIGPDGKVYSNADSLLVEIDPDTGATLRSVSGTFATYSVPSLTAGMIWTNSGYETTAYDLQTFQPARTFPGANFGNVYDACGAFTDGYFVMDRGVLVGNRGFDVYAEPASQSVNLSTRMQVQTGANVGIGGFIITGTAPKHVLLRAIGPSLAQAGVPNVLADPVMELHLPDGTGTITNDNWRDNPAQEAAIIATGIPPTNDLESAIYANLSPGAYTAIVKGNGNTSGVALVEVYDLDKTVGKLANISTRAFVGTNNDIVIAGFILSGASGQDSIVVRGLGPSLSATGVPDALADPTLELRNGDGALLLANNDWQDNPMQVAELTTGGLAPGNALESAIATMQPPGLYTVLLAGRSGGTGVGLVEVYDRSTP
jgi:hypothetical protein